MLGSLYHGTYTSTPCPGWVSGESPQGVGRGCSRSFFIPAKPRYSAVASMRACMEDMLRLPSFLACSILGASMVALAGCDSSAPDDPAETGAPAPDAGPVQATDASALPDGRVEPPQTTDETDTGCGGLAHPACADGKKCKVARDCTSLVCSAGICAAPSFSDGVKNGTETDTDCGGSPAAPRCAEGKACGTGTDCDSLVCSGGKCAAPSFTDGVKNGTETDVDCGGSPAAPRCVDGKKCGAGSDCTSLVCKTSECQAPTPTDDVKNGDETDIDCGGPGNPKCAVDKSCLVHGDCASDGCGDDDKCASARSCTQLHGGRTCGAGEVGEMGATHEDCCKTITVPAPTPFELDKYSITAGRMRQFVERTGGNIRAWVTAYPPPGWNPAWNASVPVRMGNAGDTASFDTVVSELGPTLHGAVAGANMGCYVDGIGARSFWLPKAVNEAMGDHQYYTQAELDAKMLNCVTFWMLKAFCAWDGGDLPSFADLDLAWNGVGATRTYPWGNTPAASGCDNAYPFPNPACPKVPAGSEFRANYNYNYWFPALRKGLNVGGDLSDYTQHLAAPGRFATGAGPYGHMDLAGGVFNMTNQVPAPNALWFRNGSWQGHAIPYGSGVSVSANNKYWAMGGRCKR